MPRFQTLPWIPSDEQWQAILRVAREEPIRDRMMLALAYDAGLRREELCALRTDDLDPAHRTILKVSIEEAVEADKTFNMLMGDEVAPRKRFIESHAKSANLDV